MPGALEGGEEPGGGGCGRAGRGPLVDGVAGEEDEGCGG